MSRQKRLNLLLIGLVAVLLSACYTSPADPPVVTEYYATETALAVTASPDPTATEVIPTPTQIVWPTWTPIPTIAPPPDASIDVSDVVSQPATYEVAATYNIRSEPYVGARVLSSAAPGYAYSVDQIASVVYASGEYQEWLHIVETGWVVYWHDGACGGRCGTLNLTIERPKIGYQSEVVRPWLLEQDNAAYCLPFLSYGMEDYVSRYQAQCPDAAQVLRVFDAECGSDYTCVRSSQGWIGAEAGVAQIIEEQRWRWEDLDHIFIQLVDNETHAPADNRAAFWSAFSDWQIEVIKQLNAEGHGAVIGNFSVGTPEISDWQYMTEMVQYCHAVGPEWCVMGLHEYMPCTTYAGYPWLIGRYRLWLNEMHRLGIETPPVRVTETGGDFVAGGAPGPLCGDYGLVPAGAGVLEYYTAQLVTLDQLWQETDQVEAGYIFLRGHISPQWQGFEVEGEVSDRLRAYYESIKE